jgi:hypothetical protein
MANPSLGQFAWDLLTSMNRAAAEQHRHDCLPGRCPVINGADEFIGALRDGREPAAWSTRLKECAIYAAEVRAEQEQERRERQHQEREQQAHEDECRHQAGEGALHEVCTWRLTAKGGTHG